MTQLVAKQPRSVNTSLYSDSISSVSDSVLLVVRDLSEISRVREGGGGWKWPSPSKKALPQSPLRNIMTFLLPVWLKSEFILKTQCFYFHNISNQQWLMCQSIPVTSINPSGKPRAIEKNWSTVGPASNFCRRMLCPQFPLLLSNFRPPSPSDQNTKILVAIFLINLMYQSM